MDHSDNKKHKEIKKSTPGMDFDAYFNRLSDLIEYFNEFLTTGIDIDKKREAEIQSYFSNKTEVHVAKERDELDSLIETFNLDHVKTRLKIM